MWKFLGRWRCYWMWGDMVGSIQHEDSMRATVYSSCNQCLGRFISGCSTLAKTDVKQFYVTLSAPIPYSWLPLKFCSLYQSTYLWSMHEHKLPEYLTVFNIRVLIPAIVNSKFTMLLPISRSKS